MTTTKTIQQFLAAPHDYNELSIFDRESTERLLALCSVLKDNKTITVFRFYNGQIGVEGAKALAEMLKANNTITSIDLSNNELGIEGTKALAESLKVNKTITSIDLSNNEIRVGGAKALAEMLKINKIITTVHLSRNEIRAGGAKALAEMLKVNSTITTIHLNGDELRVGGAQALAESLKVNKTITTLTLWDSQIGVEGTKALAEMLKVNNTIIAIYLGHNQIGVEGTKALAESLTINKTITTFDLRSNHLKAEGVKTLIESLKVNKTIMSIDLSSNQIGVKGARFLSVILKENKVITSIDLGSNEIKAGGIKILVKSLKLNKSIKLINLSWNQIGDEGVKALVRVLKENKVITSINLSSNQIGDEGAKALAESLKTNITITTLNLWHNQIGDEGAKALAESLKTNKIVTAINLDNHRLGTGGAKTLTERLAANKNIQNPKIEEAITICDKTTNKKVTEIFSVKDGELQNDSNEKILRINELIKEGNIRLQDNNEKGILLLGKTGSGKSTLAHLLVGRELQAILDDETGMLVIDAMQPLEEISISHNKISETKIPNKCQLDNLAIWDCPGFKDTDVVQEIANAFYIKKLFENTKQLKLVLVVSDFEISNNRGTSFVETVSQMVRYFDDIENLRCSVALIVTQTPNSKQIQHILNSIDRILDQNEHLEENVQQMIVFLKKSVQIFYMPVGEGTIVSKSDILASINSTTEYCNNEAVQANISLSKEAVAYSENLLQMVSHNFNKILEVIVSAVSSPNDCIYKEDANNIFIKNHEIIKHWIPSSIQYTPMRWNTSEDYFMEIDQLKALLDIFRSRQDKITSFEEGLDIINQVLKIFEKFTNNIEEKYVKQLQEYAYVLSQQFDYIKFFSKLCQKDLPSVDGFMEVIKHCQDELESNLKQQIRDLKLEENISDHTYYIKAIQYFNIYVDDPACKNSKAKAYIQLGNIAKNENDGMKELEYYIEAIKCNIELPEIYNKLGALFYEQGNYRQAIECYKVTNNAFKIKNCFKKWIAQDEENPDIRMEKGDYYASIGSYGKAKESYHNAFSLSEDREFKAQAIRKIAEILDNKTDLVKHYNNMADNHSYNNFEIVDEQFIELLGQSFNSANSIMSELI